MNVIDENLALPLNIYICNNKIDYFGILFYKLLMIITAIRIQCGIQCSAAKPVKTKDKCYSHSRIPEIQAESFCS